MTIPAELMPQIRQYLEHSPVDVAAVATQLGLQIFQQQLAQGVSGVLVRDSSYRTPSGFVIFVNQNEAYVRQRFTASHEIGHFVLHKDRIGDRVEDNYLLRADGLSNFVEQQANKFAADLLMPYDLIKKLVYEGFSTVEDLAKELQVSEIAMGIRLNHPT